MNLDSPEKSSFHAVVDDRTRVVVFGSLPGEESLRQGRYYARSSNQFWRLIGAVIGADVHAMDYDARLDALLSAGVGLWDVIGKARRRGSLDSNIQGASANPLAAFRDKRPSVRAFGFNGAKAFEIATRQFGNDRFPLLKLPSSSAAYCAASFEQKREQWMALKAYL
jgi:TDG/mug DNA glycosylase family protein